MGDTTGIANIKIENDMNELLDFTNISIQK